MKTILTCGFTHLPRHGRRMRLMSGKTVSVFAPGAAAERRRVKREFATWLARHMENRSAADTRRLHSLLARPGIVYQSTGQTRVAGRTFKHYTIEMKVTP